MNETTCLRNVKVLVIQQYQKRNYDYSESLILDKRLADDNMNKQQAK